MAACYFAKRDYDVSLYEYRGDIRKMKVVIGKSINMAISARGREGLRRIGAEERITALGKKKLNIFRFLLRKPIKNKQQ